MNNLSHHDGYLCELVTSLLTSGIQMKEISRLGWLVRLVKHAMWADFSDFHLSFSLAFRSVYALSQFLLRMSVISLSIAWSQVFIYL
jgi:hypothetical protein